MPSTGNFPRVFDYGVRSEPCRDPILGASVLCNTRLSHDERARGFVAQLTLQEKAAQMFHEAPGIPRLGLSSYPWWNEALHGVTSHFCIQDGSDRYCSVVFPTALAQAATFNMDIVTKIGTATSDEARAVHRYADCDLGLNFWTPHINIYRDPRWGRGQETPGEDPFLTAMYAVHYIRAMQEVKDGYPKLYATVKHFAVYNVETNRNSYNAVTTIQDLWQTFLPAFKAAIEIGKAGGVMCSYNAINGVPSCANEWLLADVLRKQWKFSGHIVSDCGAINNIWRDHKFNTTEAAGAAQAVIAGTDLDCGDRSYDKLPEAVANGLISEATIDEALIRLFKTRLELGIFDPFLSQGHNQIPLGTLGSIKHRNLAREGARQSLVLLKNEKHILPLLKEYKSIAVIGPHFNTTRTIIGNYIPTELGHIATITEGIQAAFPISTVSTAQGCSIGYNDDGGGLAAAVSLAAESELVILALGMDGSIVEEGRDRSHLNLPGNQLELLKQVAASSKNPVVVVLIGGGAIDLSWANSSPQVGAILFGFYPGQETATAIGDVLSGSYSPSGRLPITFYYNDYVHDVDLGRPNMREGPGRTYRFYTGTPLYPFGFGLSYTRFKYRIDGSTLPSVIYADSNIHIRVHVANVGNVVSDHSVLAFIETTHQDCPLKQLFSFHRITGLKPRSREVVEFLFEPRMALCVDEQGVRYAPSGQYRIRVGDAHYDFNLEDAMLVGLVKDGDEI